MKSIDFQANAYKKHSKILDDLSKGRGNIGDNTYVCTDEYNPVCGTDGVVYSNQCYASNQGAQVACPGQCPCSDIEVPTRIPVDQPIILPTPAE